MDQNLQSSDICNIEPTQLLNITGIDGKIDYNQVLYYQPFSDFYNDISVFHWNQMIKYPRSRCHDG